MRAEAGARTGRHGSASWRQPAARGAGAVSLLALLLRPVIASSGLRPLGAALCDERQEVPELRALGAQVLAVGLARRDLDRHALRDGEAVGLELAHLVRIVGHQPHLARAEVEQD